MPTLTQLGVSVSQSFKDRCLREIERYGSENNPESESEE